MNPSSQNDLINKTDSEIWSLAYEAAKLDQKTSLDFLYHLREVETRRLHFEHGFSSLFAYAVEHLGFSEGAASERVNAMRLMFKLAVVENQLRSGKMSLSKAAKIQVFSKQTRTEPTEELIQDLDGLSVRETEKELFKRAPFQSSFKEKRKRVNEENIEIKFYADSELQKLLKRYQELQGAQPVCEVLKRTLKEYLKKNDPDEKIARREKRAEKIKDQSATRESSTRESAPEGPVDAKRKGKTSAVFGAEKPLNPNSKVKTSTRTSESAKRFSAHDRSKAYRRSGGQCEYYERKTGKRCTSKTCLEFDHVIPAAMGGDSSFANIQVLCRSHNLHRAYMHYGTEKMDRYARSNL